MFTKSRVSNTIDWKRLELDHAQVAEQESAIASSSSPSSSPSQSLPASPVGLDAALEEDAAVIATFDTVYYSDRSTTSS